MSKLFCDAASEWLDYLLVFARVLLRKRVTKDDQLGSFVEEQASMVPFNAILSI